MAAAGLDDAWRGDPDARVPIFALVILWREMIAGLPHVVVPVELVRALDETALGVLGQISLRADDIDHASQLVERFMKLPDTAVRAFRVERGDLVGLGIGHLPQVEAMRFPLEVMLGIGFRTLQHATNGAVPLREVTFAHAAGYPV